MNIRASFAATLALAIAVPAVAQDRPGSPGHNGPSHNGQSHDGARPAGGDTDGDGIVTRAEAEAEATRRFAERDVNADGKLDAAEMPRRGGPGAPRRADAGRDGPRPGGRIDANGDGVVERVEFVANALTRFDRLDTDRDGRVTPDERQAAMDAMRARWQSMRIDAGPGGEGAPPPMPQD